MTDATDTESQPAGSANVDPAEIEKFNEWASRWWDPAGELKPLHQMNPVRVGYIDERVQVSGKRCLDVGCGGGLLTEALAALGGTVTGIDLAPASVAVARLHVAESGHDIRYLETSAEALADTEPGAFDLVTCLEVLEHVPDPAGLIASLARLVRPGGDVIVSTLNRNPKAIRDGHRRCRICTRAAAERYARVCEIHSAGGTR